MIDLPMKANIQDNNVDIFYRDTLIAKARRGKIVLTKVKMTRAEAIACFEKHNPHDYNTSHMVDFYIEAGMLEVVEEPEKPIFELKSDYENLHIRIYANGRVDGFKGTIINRIPPNTKPI